MPKQATRYFATHHDARRYAAHLASKLRHEDALRIYDQTDPDEASLDLRVMMNYSRLRIGRAAEAIRDLRLIIRRHPERADAYRGLISAFFGCGDVPRAIRAARAAQSIEPTIGVASFLCRMFNYIPSMTRAALLARHKEFAADYCTLSPFPGSRRSRAGRRKIRIGYVSMLFQQHRVMPGDIYKFHDTSRFSIYCFHDGERPPSPGPAKCIDTSDLTDRELGRLIRKHEIDILVELDGHFSSGQPSRLPLFAARAAPVQMSLYVYPSTSGVPNIDYRISDPVLDPPGTDRFFSEKLIRLPRFASFDPKIDRGRIVRPPCLRNGYITFGCFGIPAKLNDEVARLWATILRRVPGSRLLLHHYFDNKGVHTVNPVVSEHLLGMFRRQGAPVSRIDLVGGLPERKHRRLYNSVDIALDSFPYNGTLTTLDALYRGLPVVVLEGKTNGSRVGAAMLNIVGLNEFLGATESDYIRIAVDLARDPQRLARLRPEIARRSRATLGDSKSYVRELENAFLRIAGRDSTL